jgi:hypothetical protein
MNAPDPLRVRQGPTVDPNPDSLNSALRRNIEALRERRRQDAQERSASDRVADTITGFTGSMTFVALHLALFGFWIIANLGWIPAYRAGTRASSSPRDDRQRRGDLPVDLRADQPEPMMAAADHGPTWTFRSAC